MTPHEVKVREWVCTRGGEMEQDVEWKPGCRKFREDTQRYVKLEDYRALAERAKQDREYAQGAHDRFEQLNAQVTQLQHELADAQAREAATDKDNDHLHGLLTELREQHAALTAWCQTLEESVTVYREEVKYVLTHLNLCSESRTIDGDGPIGELYGRMHEWEYLVEHDHLIDSKQALATGGEIGGNNGNAK